MELSVATNFDDRLIEDLKGYPVRDVFGKLSEDVVGGGRSSYLLGRVSKGRLESHIKRVHGAGFRFNYLLNAACLGNLEGVRRGQRRIRELLDYLVFSKVDSVTVSIPYLLRLVKRSYPALKVRISVFAQIDTVSKAKWWVENGADALTLDSQSVNREFAALRAIREAVSVPLQLLVNNHCLARCPMAGYHMDVLAHSSQKRHASGGFVIDHCFLSCTAQKLRTGLDFIRGEWIRPEDLQHYERIGYSWFKIVERNSPTDVLIQRVKAYAERRYEGNLLDLVQPYGYGRGSGPEKNFKRGLFWSWRMLLGISDLRLGFLKRLRRYAKRRGFLQPLPEPAVTVDNRRLDGFIERFLSQGCRDTDCEKCGYCDAWARKALFMEPHFREASLKEAGGLLEALESGRAWR